MQRCGVARIHGSGVLCWHPSVTAHRPARTKGRTQIDPERDGLCVDDRLKELMQELGNAINESLSDSERIASAIGEIKRAGYDVFLVLEATIGFNKRDENDEEESGSDVPAQFETAGKIKWTSQDHKFLRALKISVDEENH
jgi:hypothetical protein